MWHPPQGPVHFWGKNQDDSLVKETKSQEKKTGNPQTESGHAAGDGHTDITSDQRGSGRQAGLGRDCTTPVS